MKEPTTPEGLAEFLREGDAIDKLFNDEEFLRGALGKPIPLPEILTREANDGVQVKEFVENVLASNVHVTEDHEDWFEKLARRCKDGR